MPQIINQGRDKIFLFALILFFSFSHVYSSDKTSPPTLEAGYRKMYNFDLSAAHAIFREFQRLHPDDPMGPASDAAVYLFSELDRLHILESDFFTDDEKIRKQRPAPDLEVKKMFEGQLAKGPTTGGQGTGSLLF